MEPTPAAPLFALRIPRFEFVGSAQTGEPFVQYIVQAAELQFGRPTSSWMFARRFRHFASLNDAVERAGITPAPALPPKGTLLALLGIQPSPVFVEERRAALERYIQGLARHPSIHAVREWFVFLGVGPDSGDMELATFSSSGQQEPHGRVGPADPSPAAGPAARPSSLAPSYEFDLSLLPLEAQAPSPGVSAALDSSGGTQHPFHHLAAAPGGGGGAPTAVDAWSQDLPTSLHRGAGSGLLHAGPPPAGSVGGPPPFGAAGAPMRPPPPPAHFVGAGVRGGSGNPQGRVSGELQLHANHFSAPQPAPSATWGRLSDGLLPVAAGVNNQYFSMQHHQPPAAIAMQPLPQGQQQWQQQQQHARFQQQAQQLQQQQYSVRSAAGHGGAQSRSSSGSGSAVPSQWGMPPLAPTSFFVQQQQQQQLLRQGKQKPFSSASAHLQQQVADAPGWQPASSPPTFVFSPSAAAITAALPPSWYTAADEIIAGSRGTPAQRLQRVEASRLLALLVRRKMGSYAFEVGASATGTDLAADNVSLSAFVFSNREQGWFGRLLDNLLRLACLQTGRGGEDGTASEDWENDVAAATAPPDTTFCSACAHQRKSLSGSEGARRASDRSSSPRAARPALPASTSAADPWQPADDGALGGGAARDPHATRSSSSSLFGSMDASGVGGRSSGVGGTSFLLPMEHISLQHASPPLDHATSATPYSWYAPSSPLALQTAAGPGSSSLGHRDGQQHPVWGSYAGDEFPSAAFPHPQLRQRHPSSGSIDSQGGSAFTTRDAVLATVFSLFPPPPASITDLRVRSVKFTAGVTAPRLQCEINDERVEVVTNSLHELCLAAIVETANRVLAPSAHFENLFKRSIVLLRSWATFDQPALAARQPTPALSPSSADSTFGAVASDAPRAVRMPWNVCVTLLLWVFLRRGHSIQHPLEAVLAALGDAAQFPFDTHALSLYGALPRGGSQLGGRAAGSPLPEVCQPVQLGTLQALLPEAKLERLAHRIARAAVRSAAQAAQPSSQSGGGSQRSASDSETMIPNHEMLRHAAAAAAFAGFDGATIAILDPLDPQRNLARGLSVAQAESLLASFRVAASALHQEIGRASAAAPSPPPRQEKPSKAPKEDAAEPGTGVGADAGAAATTTAPEEADDQNAATASPERMGTPALAGTAASPGTAETSPGGATAAPLGAPAAAAAAAAPPGSAASEMGAPLAAVFPVSRGLFVGSPSAFASATSVDHPLFPAGDASGRLGDQLDLCGVLLQGELNASSLAALGVQLLADKGALPVGEVGKLLADAVGLPSLSHVLKERFGGLKRFLEAHADVFVLGGDHPFNPHVSLADDLPGALRWLAAGGDAALVG